MGGAIRVASARKRRQRPFQSSSNRISPIRSSIAWSSRPVDFVESLYSRDIALSRLLEELRRGSAAGSTSGPAESLPGRSPDELPDSLPDATWLDERLYALLSHLLSLHTDLLDRIDALPAIKRSTRIEQYRRLRRARDFIDAYYSRDIALTDIARTACLSPYHLLRLFKEAFGLTPHQYATHKRLHQARRLLENTDLPVGEICHRVGYESLGSFSHRIKNYFGASPQQLRSK